MNGKPLFTLEKEEASMHAITRRQVLSTAIKAGGGLAALAAAGDIGYRWPKAAARGQRTASGPGAGDVAYFKSRPDLGPPNVSVTIRAGTLAANSGTPRPIFVAPKGYSVAGPGQQGPMILGPRGRLVWFLATDQSPMNLMVQRYKDQPVLTWWQGQVFSGYGEGTGLIYDSSYRQVAAVQAGNGLKADLHEFRLTSQGTALLTAYHQTTADLSAAGGPSDGPILDCVTQEVDVASGAVLFEWHSLDYVGVEESYVEPANGTAYDYFHINSVNVAPDGDLLISARNTWAIYKVSRSSGQISWRLNGKKSDFTMGEGAQFAWQHDAQPLGADRLSLFDDAASPPVEDQSRGVVLSLDTRSMKATRALEYTHPARLLAANQGSMQVLPEGGAFIGWGAQPYFSHFDRDGRIVLDGRFPANDQSYRAYTFDWTGQPADAPAVAIGSNDAGGATVYVSWNGTTQVARWQVLAGTKPAALVHVATAAFAGFETAISVNTAGPYFAVAALDSSGQTLGRSKVVKA